MAKYHNSFKQQVEHFTELEPTLHEYVRYYNDERIQVKLK